MNAALESPERAIVLVVEDFEPLRRLLRDCLERLDFHVLEAEDRESAETVHRRSGAGADLLLCDLAISGGALQLARNVRDSQRGIPILFLSFYDGILEEYCSGSLHGARFLTKPFTFAQLRETVLQLIGTPHTRTAVSHNRTFEDQHSGADAAGVRTVGDATTA